MKRLTTLLVWGLASIAVADAPHSRNMDGSAEQLVPVTSHRFQIVLPLPGVIKPAHRYEVSSRLTGFIRAIEVDAGDNVRKGQILARIDARTVETRIAEARATILGIKVELNDAEADVRRLKGLTGSHSVAEDVLRNAGVRKAKADAEMQAALARVRALEVDLGDSDIRAPADAVVVERLTEPGTLATTAKVLLVLESSGHPEIEAFLPLSFLNQVNVGEAYPVILSGESHSSGVLLRKTPLSQENSQQARLRFRLLEDRGAVVGSHAQVRLRLGEQQTLAVPTTAITRRAGINGVFTRDTEGLARFRSVEFGRQQSGRREVLAGLESGEQVVVHPGDQLSDGFPLSAP
ncbi:MAG: efflux RND transporter periplasmic adaptor subunit [Gammaproteobacteria bacterium]